MLSKPLKSHTLTLPIRKKLLITRYFGRSFCLTLYTPILSSPRVTLLKLDLEKKVILDKEAQLAELKGYVKCDLPTHHNKTDSFNASLKTSFTSFENCEKSNVDFLLKKTLLPSG